MKKWTKTNKELGALIYDAIDHGYADKEIVYQLAAPPARAKAIGNIFYIKGSDLTFLDSNDGERDWDDFIVVSKGDEDTLSPSRIASKKTVNWKIASFDEVPRDFPLTFFAASFGVKEPISTNQHD